MIRSFFCKHKQILLYLFFGITTTAVNWCVYAALHGALRWDMTLCNAMAWLAAVVYAFVTNKLFVFESKSLALGLLLTELAKFLAARLASGALEILLPTALVAIGLDQTVFGLPGGIAKALVSILVIAANYVFSKWLVFTKK